VKLEISKFLGGMSGKAAEEKKKRKLRAQQALQKAINARKGKK